MTSWFRLHFLFSSFGPLYALIAIVFLVQGNLISAVIAALLAACALLTFLALAAGLKKKSSFGSVIQLDGPLDQHILSHLISYLPPVLVSNFAAWEQLAPALGFYLIVFGIMMKADTIYVNPFFLWFGYRIYQVRLDTGRQVTVVTKRKSTVSGDRLTLFEVDATRLYFAE